MELNSLSRVSCVFHLGDSLKVAAFDVDAQKCFTDLCPDELPVPGGTEIVAELNRQAELASVRLGSKDAHPSHGAWEIDPAAPQQASLADYPNVDRHWPRHGVRHTRGCELLPGLPPVSGYDYFVWKGIEPDMHPYGACYHDLAGRMSTGAIEFLTLRGIETVLVAGLALDYCVKVTALQLARAGFRVVLNRAGCRGVQLHSSAAAIEEMTAAGIVVVDCSAVLSVDQAQVGLR